MIIGGREVYQAFLPLGPALHVTVVEGEFDGDVYFPVPVLGSPFWVVTHKERWPADEANVHDATYLILTRAPP
jgi:dihydrofolate reductase